MEGLNAEGRALLAYSPLQYMFDFVCENPRAGRSYWEDGRLALTFGHHLFLGGPVDADFLRAVAAAEWPKARREELEVLLVFYDREQSALAVKAVFEKVYDNARSLYIAENPAIGGATGERVTPIAAALSIPDLDNREMILEEVLGTGTYRSMEDFCARGIGYTYLENGRVRAFLTSEYPSAAALAIGIEVEEECQKRGIASEMTRAFLKEAGARGVRVYWECWKQNEPSVRTALRAGFAHVADYPVLFVVFDG